MSNEPYQAPHAEFTKFLQSMFGNIDRPAQPVTSGMVSKTTISILDVEVQRTSSSTGGSTYVGLRSTPALAVQTTIEESAKVSSASGITAKVSASAGAGQVGVTGSASVTIGTGISAQVSGGAIGLANDKGSFSPKGEIIGVRPPAAGIGITLTDKDAKKIIDLVR